MKVYSFSINNMIYHLPPNFPKFENELLDKINDIRAVEDKDLAMKFLDIGFTDQIMPRDIDGNNPYVRILTNEEADELITAWKRYAKKHPEALPNYDLYKL